VITGKVIPVLGIIAGCWNRSHALCGIIMADVLLTTTFCVILH
jgi:hypothetical protein